MPDSASLAESEISRLLWAVRSTQRSKSDCSGRRWSRLTDGRPDPALLRGLEESVGGAAASEALEASSTARVARERVIEVESAVCPTRGVRSQTQCVAS